METPFENLDWIKSRLSAEVREKYLDFWGHWNELNRFVANSYVNRPIREYLVERGINIQGKKILEFGCRDVSSFVSFLLGGVKEIVGIDIDKKVIQLSSLIYRNLGYENIEYRIALEGKPLPIEKSELDIVSCNAVLEHLNPKDRGKYIAELQKGVKIGGFLIISDTPNRLWYKDGHTTGLWFVNWLPIKIKCWIGGFSARYRGKLRAADYEKWIEQGIHGVTYSEIWLLFDKTKWSNSHDLGFRFEYRKSIFEYYPTKNLLKLLFRYIIFLYCYFIDKIYLKSNRYPSLAIGESLLCSFKRTC